MASKLAKGAFTGSHTAGIYADMTVDGPEIGTLVVIVDRAKNLPNRKTMGKQDPYCAARLGKEAKKTETDKRGGQTPRWDQEMRFTVHDSPDYYQLKVSVFNDDKKTELIGETWVSLDQIVVPGGGQNDLWHHLSCKGRFAGEIRIEITYYDTRPKEERTEERRQEALVEGIQTQPREDVNGPRQPKQIKRRPLPADPTEALGSRPINLAHSQSSPAAFTPPSKNQHPPNAQPIYSNEPATYELSNTPPSSLRYHSIRPSENQGSPVSSNINGQEIYNDAKYKASPIGPGASAQHEIYDQSAGIENRQPNGGSWHQEMKQQYAFDRQLPYGEEHYPPSRKPAQEYYRGSYHHNDSQSQTADSMHVRPFVQPLQEQQDENFEHAALPLPQPHSMPDVRPNPILQTFSKQGHRYSLPDTHDNETPPRQRSHVTSRESWSSPIRDPIDDEGPPPPPPAHRSSGLRWPPQADESGYAERFSPPSAPAPLNIRSQRGNSSASPLSQVQSNAPPVDYLQSTSPISHAKSNNPQYGYLPSTSPSNSYQLSLSGASVSPRTSYSQPSQKRSQNNLALSPTKDYVYALPPSLVPGYEPSIAEDESKRLLDEKRTSNQSAYADDQAPQYHSLPNRNQRPDPNQQYQPPPMLNSQLDQSSQYSSLPTHSAQPEDSPQHQVLSARNSHARTYPSPGDDNQMPLRQQEIAQVRKPHRSSVPTTKPRAISPDPRTPVRKSVSPAPEPTSAGRKASAIPYSPDSYDTFNPSLSAASSINSRGPKYNTPEQAKEAFYERQQEARLGEGPIIGSNGRIIDPSDHLPTETWAPEPETKQPRKGPEITLRFRHSPQGAQPMPQGARRPLRDINSRPHSISNPLLTNSPNPNSPTDFAERSRLQKKSRVSPGQPASSPTVPMLHTATSGSSMPRASTSDYPVRERDNYGYSSGSPIYPKASSANNGIPPPVPGKIPISSGRAEEDWSSSALSEEMRRIDIGVGGGQGRSRRNRLGA